MIPTNPPLLHKFLNSWRQLYRSVPDREYDPEWIWQMFIVYWNFLRSILGNTHELVQVNAKQWHSYEIAIKKPESVHHQSRRSGKTLKLSHLCVFFAELEFGPCKGKVIYRCPHINQLKGLKQWLRQNPFFVKYNQHEYECTLFDAAFPLDIACISDATSTGLECSVLLEDEYSTIKKASDTELLNQMRDTRAFLAKGPITHKRHIHASSGRKNSPFEDDYNYITEHDPEAYFKMAWYETSWLDKDFIEKERIKMFDAAFWIEEQYECLWVQAGGMFFNQSHLHIVDPAWFDQKGLYPRSAGLDWNGDAVGHVLYTTYHHDNNLYIFSEEIFKQVKEVKEWIDHHPTIELEVEGKPKKDGYNAGFSDHLQSMNAHCSYQGWSADESIKDNRLAILQRSEIYVVASCRWFLKNFKEASYDPLGDRDGKPKLLKRPDQHGLDAVLHSDRTGGDIDVVSSFSQTQQKIWEDTANIIRMHSRV